MFNVLCCHHILFIFSILYILFFFSTPPLNIFLTYSQENGDVNKRNSHLCFLINVMALFWLFSRLLYYLFSCKCNWSRYNKILYIFSLSLFSSFITISFEFVFGNVGFKINQENYFYISSLLFFPSIMLFYVILFSYSCLFLIILFFLFFFLTLSLDFYFSFNFLSHHVSYLILLICFSFSSYFLSSASHCYLTFFILLIVLFSSSYIW